MVKIVEIVRHAIAHTDTEFNTFMEVTNYKKGVRDFKIFNMYCFF